MKKRILIPILAALIIFSCNNEEKNNTGGYDEFYDLHQRDNGVITIGMPVFVFKLFIDRSNKQVREAVDQIETIDLFIKEDSENSFWDEIMRHFPSSTYKNLYGSNTDELKLKFLIKEKNDRVDELIMVAEQKAEKIIAIMRIGGDFNFKDIERLAEKIDVYDLIKYR